MMIPNHPLTSPVSRRILNIRNWTTLIVLVFSIFPLSTPSSTQAAIASPPPQQTAAPYAHPGAGLIVQNAGQFDKQVRYAILGTGGITWLTDNAIWITTLKADSAGSAPGAERRSHQAPQDWRASDVRLVFIGANAHPKMEPSAPLATHVSYLIGADSNTWHVNIPVWQSVRYRDLYPGVDLVVNAPRAGSDLRFNWQLEGRQDGAGAVRLHLDGVQTAQEESNLLVLNTGLGELRLPLIQSPGAGEQTSIQRTGLAAFDVISPLTATRQPGSPASAASTGTTVAYSTYLGGSSWEFGYGIATASDGSAFVTGRTASADFPTTPGAFDTSLASTDAFVAKLNDKGDSLIYATYMGGSADDMGYSIAVSNDEAYVAGRTSSSDFPLSSGSAGGYDAFAVCLNSTGTGLIYGLTWGGSNDDAAWGITVAGSNAYITGNTSSSNYPATGFAGGTDAFVAELSGSGNFIYNTLLGGSDVDNGYAIAVHNNEAWFTGSTYSSNFPGGGYQGNGDVFVAKANSNGAIVYDRLIGGTNLDVGTAIDVDSSGQVYVAGYTGSSDFPSSVRPYRGNTDAFVVQLSASGTILYSTYLGGSGYDEAEGIRADGLGGAIVAGVTASSNLTVTQDAYQPTLAGTYDAFVIRVIPQNSAPFDLDYASYFGGSNYDSATAVALDGSGYAYITGYTLSTDFPISAGAFDSSLNGSRDVFISKLLVIPPPSITLQKLTNGQHVLSEPGVVVPAGSSITWQYVVTNTGKVALNNVTVTDDQPAVAPGCPITTLVSGASMVCTASGSAIVGQYANTGIVTGTPIDGRPIISNSDRSYYFGTASSIVLKMTSNNVRSTNAPGPFLPAGEPLDWSLRVTNTGNISLTNILLNHSIVGTVACPSSTLSAGAAMDCLASGTVVSNQQMVTATVTGAPSVGSMVQSTDTNYYYGVTAGVLLSKQTNGTESSVPPGPFLRSGAPVSWMYWITNTGNATQTITLMDDHVADVSCPASQLEAGAAMTCDANGVVVAGLYSNTAVVTGTPLAGAVVNARATNYYFGAAPALTPVKYTNSQFATSSTGPFIPVGQPVTWTYVITNSGNVALNAIVLNDNRVGSVSCPSSSLDAGSSMTCMATGIATQGLYTNSATVTGTPPVGGVIVANSSSSYYGIAPALTLHKLVNSVEATMAPGPFIPAGQVVTWTYLVSNTGNITLSNLALVDNQIGPISCGTSILSPSAGMQCTATGIATSGQYSNSATLTGIPPAGASLSASSVSYYFGSVAAISITKLVNGILAPTPPGPYILNEAPVTWTYQVTNTGNITLTQLSVSDDHGVTVSCPRSILAPAETTTCSAQGVAITGSYSNTGIAMASPLVGDPVSATSRSYYFGASPHLQLYALVNDVHASEAPGLFLLAGQPVTFTYFITNTGNVSLSGILVTDTQLSSVTCPLTSLLPMQVMQCTGTGILVGTGQDVVSARASGSNGPLGTSTFDTAYYYGSAPQITFAADLNGYYTATAPGPYVLANQSITWTFHITNTGNVTLTGIVVTSTATPVTCPTSTLSPGQVELCLATSIAYADQHTEQSSVVAFSPVNSISATAVNAYFGALPSLSLAKYTNGVYAPDPPGPSLLAGTSVTWSYVVSNTGNVMLASFHVNDDHEGAVACPVQSLLIGQVTTCQAEGLVQSGVYENVGTASASPPDSLATVASTSMGHYVGLISQPKLAVIKSVNGQQTRTSPGLYVLAGDMVTWTYLVVNEGNTEISGIIITDSREAGITCPNNSLNSGGSMSCQVGALAITGDYSNGVEVSGWSPLGDSIIATDTSCYFGAQPAASYTPVLSGVTIGQAGLMWAPSAQPITLTYFITNTGNVALTLLSALQNVSWPVSCPDSLLAPGGSIQCMSGGLAQSGNQLVSTTLSLQPPGVLNVLVLTGTLRYFGTQTSISITKLVNDQWSPDPTALTVTAGNAMTWTYVITNTSNITLYHIVVNDDRKVSVTCPTDTLEPTLSLTCTGHGIAVEGVYSNTGTVSAQAPGGTLVSSSSTSYYVGEPWLKPRAYLPFVIHLESP